MTFMAVILLFIFFVLFFLYFWGLNPHMVTIFYLPEQSLTHPAAMVVIACIVLGLILGFGVHLYSTLSPLDEALEPGSLREEAARDRPDLSRRRRPTSLRRSEKSPWPAQQSS